MSEVEVNIRYRFDNGEVWARADDVSRACYKAGYPELGKTLDGGIEEMFDVAREKGWRQ